MVLHCTFAPLSLTQGGTQGVEISTCAYLRVEQRHCFPRLVVAVEFIQHFLELVVPAGVVVAQDVQSDLVLLFGAPDLVV